MGLMKSAINIRTDVLWLFGGDGERGLLGMYGEGWLCCGWVEVFYNVVLSIFAVGTERREGV